MTHGQIIVRDRGDAASRQPVTLHAFSDGHSADALQMLLSLPHDLFAAARRYASEFPAYEGRLNGHDGQPLFKAPSFYAVMGPHRRRYVSRDDLNDAWDCWPMLHVQASSVASWIAWQQFPRWEPIPKHYAYFKNKPDFTVTCDDEAGRFAVTARGEDPDAFVDALNAKVTDADSKITRKGNVYEVPVINIILDLLWQDHARHRDAGEKRFGHVVVRPDKGGFVATAVAWDYHGLPWEIHGRGKTPVAATKRCMRLYDGPVEKWHESGHIRL